MGSVTLKTFQGGDMPIRTALALRLAFGLTAAMLLFASTTASAEPAWVRVGIRLNLRTDAGTEFRIIGVIGTGDAVSVVARKEGWTQVRLPSGDAGWIPEGYLQPEPPPTVRLEQLEDEVTSLRAQLESSNARNTKLEDTNRTLGSRDGDQRSEIERLSLENNEMRAGRRWPEWITGASVLAAGMLLGAIIHRNATRRPNSRIRL